jgi:hypothetical protein
LHQVELYLRGHVEDQNIPPILTLAAVEAKVLSPGGSINPDSTEGRVKIGLFDCLQKS